MVAQEEFEHGIDCMEHQRWDDAIAAFNNAIAYARKNKMTDAIAACEKAVELRPDSFKAWTNLGWFYSIKKDNEKAVSACTKATEIKPNEPLAWINLGAVSRAAKDFESAEAAFRKAIELQGINHEAWGNMALLLDAKQDIKGAMEAREKAIKILPNDGFAESYNMFLKSNPGDPGAMTLLGIDQEAQQHQDVAIELYKKAVKNNKDSILLWYCIGTIAEKKN